jgi:hydroxypyruvate reductase
MFEQRGRNRQNTAQIPAKTSVSATPQECAVTAVTAGVNAAHPDQVLSETLTREGDILSIANNQYDLSKYEEVSIIGGGNAAGRITQYLTTIVDDHLTGGIVITDDPVDADPVNVVTGTHPLPSRSNITAAEQMRSYACDCGANTLSLVVITGGGSALLSAPAENIDKSALRRVTQELIQCGAPIDRINAVRKHISTIKGGQLARALTPAQTVGLIFSDVTSGNPSVVASGPLSPDSTTYADALMTLREYDVNTPESVRMHLQRGANGDIDETPSELSSSTFDSPTTIVLADGMTALDAAANACSNLGYEPLILSSSIRGEAREAAKTHVAIAEEVQRNRTPIDPPAAILAGGETTVTVTGDGVGGPNQEFALAAALELPSNTALCAIDTDGFDGPTDAAGATVTTATVNDNEASAARAALKANDAYSFLDDNAALMLSTEGATGTNVNDLRVLTILTEDT